MVSSLKAERNIRVTTAQLNLLYMLQNFLTVIEENFSYQKVKSVRFGNQSETIHKEHESITFTMYT